MPLDKPVESLTEADLAGLISNGVREDRTLDLKRDLKIETPSEKQEFVKDVTALANTIGGHIVFGMDEVEGIATQIVPITGLNLDDEVLKLDSCLRDGAAPRVPGVKFHRVNVSGGEVLVVHIPKSWTGPHMIKGNSKFYQRASNGAFPMDVSQIREAFLNADSVHDRVRRFRAERLHIIQEGKAFDGMETQAAIVLHLCSLAAFSGTSEINVFKVGQSRPSLELLAPLGLRHWNRSRYTFEGLMRYGSMAPQDPKQFALSHLFRTGCIEGINTLMLHESNPRGKAFVRGWVETTVNDHLKSYAELLRSEGLDGPAYIMLTFLNVQGYSIVAGLAAYSDDHMVDRNDLLIPEIFVENLGFDPVAVMRPAYDVFWNACNFARCFLYDEQGNWKPKEVYGGGPGL